MTKYRLGVLLLALAMAALSGGGLRAQTVESMQRQKKAEQARQEAARDGKEAKDGAPQDKTKSARGGKDDAAKNKSGLTLVGSLGANVTASWSSGVYNASPFSIFSYANFILGYNELTMPIYFNYANVAAPGLLKNPKESLGLPTYMYGATPMWRNWKAHMGYSNMRFSQYTYYGMQFIGGGLEYNGKYVHFAGFGGYMNLETQVKQKTALQNYSDSLLGLNIKSSKLPQFKRNVVGANIGLGNKRNYFDISIVKMKDDLESLSDSVSYKGKRWHRDSLVKAKENMVVGLSTQLYFTKNVYVGANGAASVYTADLLSKDVDARELVGNTDNAMVQDLLNIIEKGEKVMKLRSSTSVHMAGDAYLGITTKPYRGTFTYRIIQPEYKSLGTTLTNQNLKSLAANGNLRLFKGHSILSYSAYGQRDNLSKKQKYTNQIATYSFNWMNRFDNFSLLLAGNGIKQDQFDGTLVVNDTLRVNQLTHSLMAQPSYSFGKSRTNTVNLNFSLVQSKNLNELRPVFMDVKTSSMGCGYSLDLGSRSQQVGANYDFTNSHSSYSNYKSHTLGVGYTGNIIETVLSQLSVSCRGTLGINFVTDSGDVSKVASVAEVWYGYEKASYEVIDVTEFSYNLMLSLRYTNRTGHLASLTASLCNFSNREVIGTNVSTTMNLKVSATYAYSFGKQLLEYKEKTRKPKQMRNEVAIP